MTEETGAFEMLQDILPWIIVLIVLIVAFDQVDR